MEVDLQPQLAGQLQMGSVGPVFFVDENLGVRFLGYPGQSSCCGVAMPGRKWPS